MSDNPARKVSPIQGVPHAMERPYHVPKERYYDREFFELEKEKLWYKTWQMACRLQEIPKPNDYVEYEICDQSILVVRQADDSIKAFFNVCPHRATQIAKGSGTLPGGQFTCPFHGWRWNVDGSSSLIYGEEGFAPECLQREEIDLRECRACAKDAGQQQRCCQSQPSIHQHMLPAELKRNRIGHVSAHHAISSSNMMRPN